MWHFLFCKMVQREPDNDINVLVCKGVERAAPILAGANDVTVVQGSQLV
jgi:hypothetical protein